jgi:hypothetical protein
MTTPTHPPLDWKWYGKAAHFICGDRCQFHMATEIGDYLISTVGEYLPDESVREIHCKVHGIALEGRGDARLQDYMTKCGFEPIGYQRLYETMVFKISRHCNANGCNCGMPRFDGSELDFDGYNDSKSATDGHMAMCAKWSKGKP